MGWYKLIFKQKQPIHIGKFKWGIVSETEIFIPGWTMWGALVSAYILKNKNEIHNEKQIQQIQKAFETITNFFPSLDGENILEPQYKSGKFYLGDYSEERFRYEYVKADFKTAIEPILRKAKDEHLYEFEYITSNKLSWIGLIKLEKYENFLQSGLEIFIGGDTRYGYGLLQLENIDKNPIEELEKWNLDSNGKLKIENNSDNGKKNRIKHPLKNFLEFDENIKFEGELKIIPELNFRQNTPIVTNAKHFITVGSKIIEIKSLKGEYLLNKGRFIKTNS